MKLGESDGGASTTPCQPDCAQIFRYGPRPISSWSVCERGNGDWARAAGLPPANSAARDAHYPCRCGLHSWIKRRAPLPYHPVIAHPPRPPSALLRLLRHGLRLTPFHTVTPHAELQYSAPHGPGNARRERREAPAWSPKLKGSRCAAFGVAGKFAFANQALTPPSTSPDVRPTRHRGRRRPERQSASVALRSRRLIAPLATLPDFQL